MTTINNNEDKPCIIIHSVNPEVDKKKIILALAASIRWYSDYLFRGHNETSDDTDLYSIAKLLEHVCNTVITASCKQNKQLIIYIPELSVDECKERFMAGLIGATRWYANSDYGSKYNVDEVDEQNLSMLSKLQQGLLKYFNQETKNNA